MGRLASAHHPVDVRAGIPDGGPRGRNFAETAAILVRAVSLQKRGDLIPFTEPEVRRLLIQIAWPRMNEDERTLMWSGWRRRHQAIAKRCHYKTRKRKRNCSTKFDFHTFWRSVLTPR